VRVLVTGAGGYIGSGLVDVLRGGGWDVRALVRREVPYLDVEQLASELVADRAEVAVAFENVDAVVHLAGENEVVAARDPGATLASTMLA